MLNNLNVKIVFGSWKSYNECNERSLGSKWLDMSDFDSVDEIYHEMKHQGFTDEELEETFIQDYESDLNINLFKDCDYINIDEAFNILEKIDFLDEYDIKVLNALIEVEGEKYVMDLIRNDELERKINNCVFYDGQSLLDVAVGFVEEQYDDEFILRYFNYDKFANELSYDNYYETADGVLLEE